MAHPPAPLVPPSRWQRLLGLLRRKSQAHSIRPVVNPVIETEMWALEDGKRPRVRHDPVPYFPVTPAFEKPRAAIPDGGGPSCDNAVSRPLLDQVRMAAGDKTGIVMPDKLIRQLLDGKLGARLMASRSLDIPLLSDFLDALGRTLVGQSWPMATDTERLRPYLAGLRLAAKREGYDVLKDSDFAL